MGRNYENENGINWENCYGNNGRRNEEMQTIRPEGFDEFFAKWSRQFCNNDNNRMEIARTLRALFKELNDVQKDAKVLDKLVDRLECLLENERCIPERIECLVEELEKQVRAIKRLADEAEKTAKAIAKEIFC